MDVRYLILHQNCSRHRAKTLLFMLRCGLLLLCVFIAFVDVKTFGNLLSVKELEHLGILFKSISDLCVLDLIYYLFLYDGFDLLACNFVYEMKVSFIWLCLSEPGYYEDGNFGIRLENVLIVKEADTKFNFGSKGYLTFEHITWVSF